MNTITRKTIGRITVASFALIAFVLPSHAARRAGDADLSFDPGSSLNGGVSAIALQSDGKVIIGGGFTVLNRAARNGIGRLNPDGTTDLTFLNGLSGAIPVEMYSALVQSNGKVLIGGAFSSVNGVAHRGIARLNPNGGLDTSFQNGMAGISNSASSDVTAVVFALAIQPDGKVLIGGLFDRVNGALRSGIARLNSDGSLDASFQNGMTGISTLVSSYPGIVRSIAVQSDGKLVIGGTFVSVNGVGRTNLARLNADGSLDTAFQNGMAGADAELSAVLLQSNGKVLIAGYFAAVNGVERNGIARLNPDGSLDTSFQDGMAGASNGSITTVVLQNDGKSVIGGFFQSINGTARNGIARLNADGSVDESFSDAGLFGANAIALQRDGRLIVAGDFDCGNGPCRSLVGRLNPDGTRDNSFQNGRLGIGDPYAGEYATEVNSLAVQPDGKVLVGGRFDRVAGEPRAGMVRLNNDGTLDGSFQNWQPFVQSGYAVSGLALQADGKILFAGYGPTLARLNADGILDGTFRNGLAVGSNGFSVSSYSTVALQPDGKVLVGGSFYHRDFVYGNSVARLNPDGSLDTPFETRFRGLGCSGGPFGCAAEMATFALQPDGKILIGGGFTGVNGTNRISLARLNADGSLDTGFLRNGEGVLQSYAGGFMPGYVRGIAVQADGKVLVGGGFNYVQVGGKLVSCAGLVRVTTNGVFDSSFAGTNNVGGSVFSLAIQPDGKILIGILSGTYGVIRLNADGTPDESFQRTLSGNNPGVRAIALCPDGNFLIGGCFITVNDVALPYVARLYGRAPLWLSNFGVSSGRFRFDVSSESNDVVVIEASVNFTNWAALATNRLGSSVTRFTDSSNQPQRLYRARLR